MPRRPRSSVTYRGLAYCRRVSTTFVGIDRSCVIEESLRAIAIAESSVAYVDRTFVCPLYERCVVFSCVALRVSLTFDLARCFGRFAGRRARLRYRSRLFVVLDLLRSLSSYFFVFVNRSGCSSCCRISLSRCIVPAYRSPFLSRVASYCLLVSRSVFVFRLYCTL